jgi:gliding motility-associated protein GldL
MNITELVESKSWKNFMAKLYGWGASVVIIGALFKIQHWPGASEMLTVGLSVEAIIFFFSAFEPIHEEIDWTLVYPELAGMSSDDEELEMAMEAPSENLSAKRNTRVTSGGGGGSIYALERFDELLEKSNIGSEIFDKLGEGLNNFSKTAEKLAKVSDAGEATNNYVSHLKNAAETVGNLSGSYSKSAEVLNSSTESLSQSVSKASELVSQSGQELSAVVSKTSSNLAEIANQSTNELSSYYQKLSEAMNTNISKMTDGSKNYGEQLVSLNKNLSALNAVYELQLKGSNDHLKSSGEIYSGLNNMMQNLKGAAEKSEEYNKEIDKLKDNLSSLNSIYGNMLSAMNVKL